MRPTLPTALTALLTTALALPSYPTPRASCPAGSAFPSDAISPYLLVPISQSEPDKAFGSSALGTVTPGDLCTIVDLKIPDTFHGSPTLLATCTLSFAIPSPEQAAPHKLSFAGPGHFSFFGYLTGFGADESTTWNMQPVPGPSPPFPPDVMVPGNTYTIATLPCGILPGSGGQTVSGRLCSEDSAIEWEQTGVSGDGGCPVGFFVVVS
ncbi:hypothetical protein BU26DRAFT_520560 [Trematosphaeria pertusa]|uniref:Ubiquitin 3 binding protein But2 C-terminal domain-containing protein n=1 Tax=Trematosphaeria pertusa TaxID=390896 RepID=A0A6A6IAV8_9PLEO|nr:uncharacterized protein BU26DRAFT_520560 [Trematosphaeria pertusa]KAF2247379.1 hypothetical protein BU26DRAFT_520560 [Trematosphaeria pertusa]